ncbi:MAG TPA: CoA-binding protein [Actinomycetota bacterium]|nr:CoA-binding protein [Actinomycetota bacterium]
MSDPEPFLLKRHMPPDDRLRQLLTEARTIAVVGLSSSPSRASHSVARYLQNHGYRIIPVNPHETEVLGERAYASLADIPERVDVVDVFRRPEYTVDVAEDAVKVGAKLFWLQSGIVNQEAERIAREGGLDVVMDACMKIEHQRLGV